MALVPVSGVSRAIHPAASLPPAPAAAAAEERAPAEEATDSLSALPGLRLRKRTRAAAILDGKDSPIPKIDA
jgi:hypothetical protein